MQASREETYWALAKLKQLCVLATCQSLSSRAAWGVLSPWPSSPWAQGSRTAACMHAQAVPPAIPPRAPALPNAAFESSPTTTLCCHIIHQCCTARHSCRACLQGAHKVPACRLLEAWRKQAGGAAGALLHPSLTICAASTIPVMCCHTAQGCLTRGTSLEAAPAPSS